MSSSRTGWLPTLIASCCIAGSAYAASPTQFQGLHTTVGPEGTTFFLRLRTPMPYMPSWANPRTFTLDVTGASAPGTTKSHPVQSPAVSAYRFVDYLGGDGKPHMRLEIILKKEANVGTRKVPGGVEIRVQDDSQAAAAPAVPETETAAKSEPSPASPAASSKKGSAIREIQVAKLDGSNDLEVQVMGDGVLEYRAMRLANPERLVLDVLNAADTIKQKRLPVNTSPLREVRIGQLSQSPLVSRVVMDLDKKIPFYVRAEANSLVVTLGESGPKNGSAETKEPAKVPTAAPPARPSVSAPNNSPNAKAPEPAGVVSESNQPKPAPSAALAPKPAAESPRETKSASAPEKPKTPKIPVSVPVKAEPKSAPAEPATRVAAKPLPKPAAPAVSETKAKPSHTDQAAQAPVQLASLEPVDLGTPQANSAPNLDTKAALVPSTPMPSPAPSIHLPSTEEPKKNLAQVQKPEPPKNAELPQNPEPTKSPEPMLIAQQQAPPSPAPSSSAQAPAPRPAYTGEPISVNLKDVDLKDFFRLVHEISGLNIVLDPTVSGNVTIVLDEVPWDQAMEIVMKNNGLGKEVEGNVVRIAKLSTLEAEEKQRTDLAIAQEKAQPKMTVTRTLSYASAKDLIPTFKRFLTERGDVIADNRTNTLIITDIPDVIGNLDRLIQTLDRKSPQVEIEARVVSASRSFARDIGVQLAASGLTGNVTLGGVGTVGASPVNRATVPPLGTTATGTGQAQQTGGSATNAPLFSIPQPLAVNFPAAGPTSGFSFLLGNGATFALDAIITAAESKGIGKLLSRPKIITQNNVEATVKQGVKIPLQTTINNTISVQYVDVVLRLTVTPQITADGTIFLKTDIENTSIDPGIATTPGQFGLDTQSATTQVLVSNGGTVFFGGVVANINRVNYQEVPLLGSVPLVGNLFKHKSTTSTTNELLFFITPRIVQS